MPVLKTATDGKVFRQNAKEYVINMLGRKQKLHKKEGCYYSSFFAEYYDFDTLEESEKSGIEYTLCKNCFRRK